MSQAAAKAGGALRVTTSWRGAAGRRGDNSARRETPASACAKIAVARPQPQL
jgi:hypothetical protein